MSAVQKKAGTLTCGPGMYSKRGGIRLFKSWTLVRLRYSKRGGGPGWNRPSLSDPPRGGRGDCLGPWPAPANPPTHPHQKNFPQAKTEIHQRGRNFEADFRCPNFFLASDLPPSPQRGGGFSLAIAWSGTQQFVHQKRPKSIFPFVNFITSHPGGRDPSVLDANYPPQLTVGRRPLGGGGGGGVGVLGPAESPPPRVSHYEIWVQGWGGGPRAVGERGAPP